MMTRPLPVLLLWLTLVVTLAVPLALDGFLRGGHVTPEQGMRHQAAMARRGAHPHDEAGAHHRHDHDQVTTVAAAAAPAPAPSLAIDAGPALLPDAPPLIAGLWLGVLAVVVAMLAPFASRPAARGARLALAGAVLAVPAPPPRG
ncbi:MAG: hypothetical protein IT340_01290 [Chloroflexi bacterium]|nr:hypothetical protein [Chloroflexota bacterium]